MVTLLKSQAIFDVDTQTTFAGSIAVDGQKLRPSIANQLMKRRLIWFEILVTK